MSSKKASCCPMNDSSDGTEIKRRCFFGLLMGLVAGVAAFCVPIYAGVKAVIFPLKQKGMGGRFYPLTTLDNLSAEPQKFPIVDDVVDAWVTVPQKTIGNVFLRKVRVDDQDQVFAFQTLCPHAGCTIGVKTMENPKTKNTETMFACPCHVAHFDLEGRRLDEKPDSPRDMDALETKIENGKVLVRFEVFAFGTSEKKSS